jgi:insertion element IS1 protein InsB
MICQEGLTQKGFFFRPAVLVLCPHGHSDQVIKGGKTQAGQHRYTCHNSGCPHDSFPLHLLSKGRAPAIKEQIVDMRLNDNGSRDTARVLKMSPPTVMNTLKKKSRRLPQ